MSASAKLVFGLVVDPFSFMYSARAWTKNETQLKYLDGLISGELVQASDTGRSLPVEIVELVKEGVLEGGPGRRDLQKLGPLWGGRTLQAIPSPRVLSSQSEQEEDLRSSTELRQRL